ncbi:Polyamine oxidase [Fusarium oxysporum f. sp. albedinis]|nr:Polyamine oxidase [Fusarium oxysporum f. sp. albedinis]
MDKILDSMLPSASYPPNVSCTLQLQQTDDETCPLRERTNVDIQSIGVNYLFLENVRDDRDTRRSIYLCTLWLFVSASVRQ